MNKSSKGSVQDLAFMFVVLVAMVFSGFLVYMFMGEFNLLFIQTINPPVETVAILDNGMGALKILIEMIPYFVISIGISAIILAFFIPTHPVFMPVSIIALALYILLSAIFSNILWVFINSPYMIGVASSFPVIVGFIQYLPYVIGTMGTILIIVMYSKSSREDF